MVKANKAKKDPSKPKKALSAWMCYCNEQRPALLKEGLKVTEVSKKLGAMWAELKDKSAYEKLAEKDKKRFLKAMEDYVPPPKAEAEAEAEAEVDSEEKPKKKAVKRDKVPRKPSGYILYGKSERSNVKSENPDMPVTKIMGEIANRWKGLSQEQRDEWNEKAKA